MGLEYIPQLSRDPGIDTMRGTFTIRQFLLLCCIVVSSMASKTLYILAAMPGEITSIECAKGDVVRKRLLSGAQTL